MYFTLKNTSSRWKDFLILIKDKYILHWKCWWTFKLETANNNNNNNKSYTCIAIVTDRPSLMNCFDRFKINWTTILTRWKEPIQKSHLCHNWTSLVLLILNIPRDKEDDENEEQQQQKEVKVVKVQEEEAKVEEGEREVEEVEVK